ncbi:MAG TPA: ATP-binding protein [Actinomycetes bacterium]|nr:ATP-binding protein [Actinomycetes bacterium]
MDAVISAGIVAAGAGLITGFAAGMGFRFSERDRVAPAPPPEPVLPLAVSNVLAVLPSSSVVLDETDTVIKASPTAYALGLVQGDRVLVALLLELARAVRRDGEIREAEFDLPSGKRHEPPLAMSARVAPLGARLVLVLVEDRTETRRLEAIRRDFVANVSHELKTPVGALALLAEAVGSASDDPAAVRRFADRMQSESLRLNELVQELIDLSRLQSREANDRPEPVLVDDLVQSAIDRTRAIAAANRIDVHAGGIQGLKVLGHERQLATALGNIVENAVNYSQEDTRVAIGVGTDGHTVEITVSDQGLGIPEREKQRIFERFYRIDPARSRATGGTGLGLSIVKHVVHNHGGEVRVWSVEGSGSTFTIALPLLGDMHAQQVREATS